MSEQPTCAKYGKIMTPENSQIHPEYFLHDACLPNLETAQYYADERYAERIERFSEACEDERETT